MKNVKVIASINTYNPELLKQSITQTNVNEKLFKIFDDDKIALWTPLIKISTLKGKRYDDQRYNGVTPTKTEDDDCKLAEIVLDNGADINAKDRNGNTALHYCVYHENYKLMELLCKRGADLNVQDNNGNTPLRLAASREREGYSYISFLISQGADKSIKNLNGEDFYTIYPTKII